MPINKLTREDVVKLGFVPYAMKGKYVVAYKRHEKDAVSFSIDSIASMKKVESDEE